MPTSIYLIKIQLGPTFMRMLTPKKNIHKGPKVINFDFNKLWSNMPLNKLTLSMENATINKRNELLN